MSVSGDKDTRRIKNRDLGRVLHYRSPSLSPVMKQLGRAQYYGYMREYGRVLDIKEGLSVLKMAQSAEFKSFCCCGAAGRDSNLVVSSEASEALFEER